MPFKRNAPSSSPMKNGNTTSSDDNLGLEIKPKIKKTKKTNTSSDGTDTRAPRIKREWTDEEETIFRELLKRQMQDMPAAMWQAVKEDGRLVHRGNMGIRSHVQAHINKMK